LVIMQPRSPGSETLASHPAEMGRLRARLSAVEAELASFRRRRWRRLLYLGLGISALIHAAIMLQLAFSYRVFSAGGGSDPLTIEFAVVSSGDLVEQEVESYELPEADFGAPISDLPDVGAPAISEIIAPPSGEPGGSPGSLKLTGSSGPGSGGSGGGVGSGGGGPTLGGGAGGTSFFGIGARGTRFAYIVDRSMSMSEGGRLEIAKRELSRSISTLPDYAYFQVVFYSSGLLVPDMQDGWLRARPSTVERFRQWLQMYVTPSGGTVPEPAFAMLLSLPVRPDVIFFMTDGEILNFTAEQVAAMNRRGKHVVINTIAFGDPTSQELLRQIAQDSGGVYRFVRSEGN
jgi:hypothetical protein